MDMKRHPRFHIFHILYHDQSNILNFFKTYILNNGSYTFPYGHYIYIYIFYTLVNQNPKQPYLDLILISVN